MSVTPLTKGTLEVQGGPSDLPIIMQTASAKSGFTSRQLGSRVHAFNHCPGQPPPTGAVQWVSSVPRGYGSPWEGGHSLGGPENASWRGVLAETWS